MGYYFQLRILFEMLDIVKTAILGWKRGGGRGRGLFYKMSRVPVHSRNCLFRLSRVILMQGSDSESLFDFKLR